MEEEAPVPLITDVNNILHSNFSNIEVNFNSQQFYESNGLYAHKFYISNIFKRAMSENKGVLHSEGYNHEEFLDEIMEALLPKPFFIWGMEMLRGTDRFMLQGTQGVEVFSTSELLYQNMKFKLRLIRAQVSFYKISDNPNFKLGVVVCSIYTGRIALKEDYQKKRVDMLA